jgi:antitoxin component YwqK of YwqJK toxin-antitoxin module
MKTLKFLTTSLVWMGLITGIIQAQDTIKTDGFQRFYYPNGRVSGEGTLRNGQPDGYWKAWNENGTLKSEGNRKNFQLDSIWKFYSGDGQLLLEINYRNGKKDGLKTTYTDQGIIRELFKNDVKDGMTRYYYKDGKIMQEIPFVNGLEQGFGKEYDTQGIIITLTEYRKGFVVDRVRINRKDEKGRRQGRWFTFYQNGNIRTEVSYRDDLMHGYFKEYAENGDLMKILRYEYGEILKEAPEVQKMDIRQEYYPNGKVKISAMFRNGIQEGIQQEYDSTGIVVRSQEFRNGKLSGEGIVQDDGEKHGPWKDYFPDGSLKAEGSYDHGKQVGEWKFYYPSGKIEQRGKFSKSGKPDGTWRWYFDNGQLLREENYRAGLKDGLSTTYDETGKVIEEGDFLEGNEDGPWFEVIGDTYTRGEYRDGMRSGQWISYYLDEKEGKTDSTCFFKGAFIEDQPNGRHVYYYPDGKVKSEGEYITGKREGNWFFYNEDGTLFLIITYRNGIEIRYDGVKIKPPMEE